MRAIFVSSSQVADIRSDRPRVVCDCNKRNLQDVEEARLAAAAQECQKEISNFQARLDRMLKQDQTPTEG